MPGLVTVVPRAGTNTAAPILDLPLIPLVEDDFERPNTTQAQGLGGNWVVPVPSWNITDGAAQYGGTAPSKAAYIDAGVTDYTLRMTMAMSQGASPIGIIFRSPDPAAGGNDFLWIRRFTKGDNKRYVQVATVTPDTGTGGATVVQEWNFSAGTGSDAVMQLDVSGTAGTITFGQTRTFTLPDGYTDPTRTWVGFAGYIAVGNPYRILDYGIYTR